jgi:glutamate---cysteine ligase / carboxylate-amine ligase
VRPKPEFGTVEIRVCDTPLTVDRAAQIAAYAQALSRKLWFERVDWINPDLYLVHGYNRFQAARHGLAGMLVDPTTRKPMRIAEDIQNTLDGLVPHAAELGCTMALDALAGMLRGEGNDAAWLRKTFAAKMTLPDVVREQAAQWMMH